MKTILIAICFLLCSCMCNADNSTIGITGELVMLQIETIAIVDVSFTQDNQTATVDIKDNITALESANLSFMFLHVGFPSHYKYLDFIKEKKLERHFIID